MRLAVAAVLALGCTPAKVPAPPDPIVVAIETGDFTPAIQAICAAYAKVDLPCAATLTLELLEPNDVMSRLSEEEQVVHMQPMPKDGFAYWNNWSRILSEGAWNPRALFADEREARRIANTLRRSATWCGRSGRDYEAMCSGVVRASRSFSIA
jgi:hypothetical protein